VVKWMFRLALMAAVIWWAVGLAIGQESQVDPTGFTQRLNDIRAARGLPDVAFDPGLVDTARSNNTHQRTRGLGHWVTGGLAQVAGVGFNTVESILSGWTFSPGHAAIIYSPHAIRIGFHCDGWACTASVAMGSQLVTSTQRATDPGPTSNAPRAITGSPPGSVGPSCSATQGRDFIARTRRVAGQCGYQRSFHPFRRFFCR